MQNIEFTSEVRFGDTVIDEITVKSLTFMELVKIWKGLNPRAKNTVVELNRARMRYQTHFMASGERVMPEPEHLTALPAKIAKSILDVLDHDGGEPGQIAASGDGTTTPIVYRLGTPISMKQGKSTVKITELEFMASTYGELEDVMATQTEMEKAAALLQNIAVPLGGGSLQRLPGWALDRITVADGVTVLDKVCPAF